MSDINSASVVFSAIRRIAVHSPLHSPVLHSPPLLQVEEEAARKQEEEEKAMAAEMAAAAAKAEAMAASYREAEEQERRDHELALRLAAETRGGVDESEAPALKRWVRCPS